MGLVRRWRLVEMDLWDLDAMELIGPACIELTNDGMGHVRFVAVEGTLDWRDAERDSRPGMEFTWNGSDDRRDGNAASDIDVLVVSDADDVADRAAELASRIERWTGNATHVVTIGATDLRRMRRAREPILGEWE